MLLDKVAVVRLDLGGIGAVTMPAGCLTAYSNGRSSSSATSGEFPASLLTTRVPAAIS